MNGVLAVVAWMCRLHPVLALTGVWMLVGRGFLLAHTRVERVGVDGWLVDV